VQRVFFFFSSRRRHTRFSRDWSSDVCSSDLPAPATDGTPAGRVTGPAARNSGGPPPTAPESAHTRTGAHKRNRAGPGGSPARSRSEEHTSELQSRENLVCRLLLEKKKNKDSA